MDKPRVARANSQDSIGRRCRRQDAIARTAGRQGLSIVVRRCRPRRCRRLLLPWGAQLDGHQGLEETVGRRCPSQSFAGAYFLHEMSTVHDISHAARRRYLYERVRYVLKSYFHDGTLNCSIYLRLRLHA